MKEDLFDDIISTDVSEEINKLFTGIYDIDDLKLYLYLETNNDIFKKTEIYDIKSDVKFLIFYVATNQILVTTGFFKLSENEKEEVKKGIKEGLEGLKGKIPGMTDIQVRIDKLASSNVDVMLDSSFESEEALKGYSVHPEHVKVANEKVRPYTAIRSCMDYEV